MICKFTVPGAPVGKGRLRVTKNGAFTPQDTVIYEKLVRHGYRLNRQLQGILTCLHTKSHNK